MNKVLIGMLFFSLAAHAHNVDLTCTPATGGGATTGFNVKRATTAGGPYATIASAPTCSFNDASTQVQAEGAKFYYVFTATGPGGESPNSNEVSATIPFSAPSAPSAPSAIAH